MVEYTILVSDEEKKDLEVEGRKDIVKFEKYELYGQGLGYDWRVYIEC